MESTIPSEGSLAPTGPLVGQSWGIRALARIIDTVILTICSAVLGGVVGAVVGIAAAMTDADMASLQSRMGAVDVTAYAFGFIATMLYFVTCHSLHGSTVGKMILGLVVVNEDGTSADFATNFKRELAYFVDGLFVGLVAYFTMKDSPLKQRIGDKWAHTVVVKRSDLKPENVRPLGTFVIVSIGALFVATLINMVPLILRVL